VDRLDELTGGHPDDCRFAAYVIRGVDVNPEEITQLTGIKPDDSWHIGDQLRHLPRRAPDSVWRINSGLADSDEFHRHIAALLARIRPAWPEFVSLGVRYSPYIDISIHLHEAQGPLVILLPDMMRDLAELNVEVGFDLYALTGQHHRDG
jgi:hypothetical protein